MDIRAGKTECAINPGQLTASKAISSWIFPRLRLASRVLSQSAFFSVKLFAPEAMEVLKNYPWPGNVLELENLIERLSVLKDETEHVITLKDLPERFMIQQKNTVEIAFNANGIDLNMAVQEFEKKLIEQALAVSKGVKSQAASLLHIKRTTLIEKIKRLSFSSQLTEGD